MTIRIECPHHPDLDLEMVEIVYGEGETIYRPETCPKCIEDAVYAAIDRLKFSQPDPGRWDKESI